MKTSFDERQAQNTVFRRMTFTPSGERKLALNEQLEIPLLVSPEFPGMPANAGVYGS